MTSDLDRLLELQAWRYDDQIQITSGEEKELNSLKAKLEEKLKIYPQLENENRKLSVEWNELTRENKKLKEELDKTKILNNLKGYEKKLEYEEILDDIKKCMNEPFCTTYDRILMIKSVLRRYNAL